MSTATRYLGDDLGGLVVERIGDQLLIAADNDLPEGLNWHEAMEQVDGTPWRLPTLTELNHLREKKEELGCTQTYYWSADEYSSSDAWNQYFSGPGAGAQYLDYKSYTTRGARPVRSVVAPTSHFPEGTAEGSLESYRLGFVDGFKTARAEVSA